MNLEDLNDLARAYSAMGDSVASQLDAILDRWDIEESIEAGEINPNALSYMRPYLEAAVGLGADDAQEALDLINEHERGAQERREALSADARYEARQGGL